MQHIIHLFMISLFLSSNIEAFIPDDLKAFGTYHGYSHVEQTRRAIRSLWERWYGGIEGWVPSGRMVNALDEIAEANALVDEDQENGELHFDGESFTLGQKRLIDLSDQAVSLVNADDYIGARKSIGMALHTLQDFYAHSNWIESLLRKGSPYRIYPRLGYSDTMIYPLSATTSTCTECRAFLASLACGPCDQNIDTIDLTSGYYDGEPAFEKPSKKKCSHGGPFDGSTTFNLSIPGNIIYKGQGINKDSTTCALSPHNHLHYDAAAVAVDATIDWVNSRIYRRLSQLQADILFGKNTTKTSLANPSDLNVWDILQYFIRPHKRELMIRAMTVNHNAHILVAVDDIHEHGKALVQAAARREGKIYPLRMIQQNTTGAREQCDDYGWRDIAIATGGHLIAFFEDEATELAALLDMLSDQNHVDILSVAATGSNQNPMSEFAFHLDSGLKSLLISTSGVSSFGLFISNGSPYLFNISSHNIQKKRVGNSIALKLNLAEIPPAGLYHISLNATANFTLSISGESDLSVVSFNFVQKGGRPQHHALLPIPSFPIPGAKSMVKAHVHGNFTEESFEFRTKQDTLIASQEQVQRDSDCKIADMFYGYSSEIPKGDFMVYFKGINKDGEKFQRVVPLMMSASSLRLTVPIIQRMIIGKPRNVTIELENLNTVSDTYDLFVVDSKDSVIKISQSSIFLGAGASGSCGVQFLSSRNATIGMTEVVFAAKGRVTKGNISLQRVLLEPASKEIPYWQIKYHQYANETERMIDRLMMGKKR